MKMGMGQAIVVIVLFIVGVYFLVWHVPPLPGNHEDVGIGKNHIVHAVIGIILILGGVLIWRRARGAKPAERAPEELGP